MTKGVATLAFAKFLRAQGVSAAELGRRLDKPGTTIGNWGVRGMPAVYALETAEALNIAPEKLRPFVSKPTVADFDEILTMHRARHRR